MKGEKGKRGREEEEGGEEGKSEGKSEGEGEEEDK